MSAKNSFGLTYASFEALKHLHRFESHQTLKFGYRLSVKALYPSNLERQNVKLVLKIFTNFVSQALTQLGGKFDILHYEDTSTFIKLIRTW